MPSTLPAGPYRELQSVEGRPLPYYVIPFDADAQCTAPLTRDHLLAAASGYTDIFLFSHGWNNDWTVATQRYEDFINGVQALRRQFQLTMPADYKPLLVGVFWPSQALEWFESETGPGMAAAAAAPAQQDQDTAITQQVLADIAASLPTADRARFYGLAQARTLKPAESQALATLLAQALSADDEGIRADAPTALDLLAAATELENPEPDPDAVGTATATDESGAPVAAFGLGDIASVLDPRNLLKPFTVWQMKDRAGRIGHDGVAPLLQSLLSGSQARVHLLGHSYGCKVVMTALCTPATLPRPVASALLLQPAISQYAFAADVPSRGVPGGFFRARERVTSPIVATYSDNDFALTTLFHKSVRRHDDLGELQFAAQGVSPSRYAAMGGFGAQDSSALFIDVKDEGTPYDLTVPERVISVDGTRTIDGHGGICNASTWWLSFQLATAHQRVG